MEASLSAADEPILLNKRQLARALGVSDPTVDRMIERGCPVEARGSNGVAYEFNLEQVRAWREGVEAAERAERERQEAAVAQAQLALVGGEARALPLEKAALEAEILRMRAERERGELVPVTDVRAAFEGTFGYLAQFLQALPDRIALQASLDPVAIDKLHTAVEDAQVELARRLMGDDDNSAAA